MSELFRTVPDLEFELRKLIAQIPPGRVTTYGALAAALGNSIAARWVGHYAMHLDRPDECPIHRIVRADGQLGGYPAGGEEGKACRLAEEGVEVAGGCVDLARYGFDDFVSDRPLQRLKQEQEQLLKQVSLRRRKRLPKAVGGVDVSYPRPDEGVAAYALVDAATGALTYSTTVRRHVRFPYVSTYLAYRELPILLDLLDEVRTAGRLAEVLLVDGNGMLHQRHAGIATHLGVVASHPTVGVSKKLLCGTVDLDEMRPLESRSVVYEGQAIGVALRASSGSRRPLFISPGHRVDLSFAEQLVRVMLRGRRLPEPIYWADRLSRQGG